MKRSTLKRGKALQRKARLRAKGKSRFPKRRDPIYADWVRQRACIIRGAISPTGRPHVCEGMVQVCHVKSRGSGGDDRANIVPMCWSAHEEQHRIGIRSFQARWGIDLKAEAERLWAQYQEEQRQGLTVGRDP